MEGPSEEALAPESAPAASGARHHWLARINAVRIISAVVTVVAIHWLAYLLITREPVPAHWLAQVAVASIAVLSGGMVFVHHYLHWTRPTRRLLAAVDQVRAGKMAIEELSAIHGGIRPLVELSQSLLRDLRRQRAEFAELEHELSQRVANRTEALERKLGTLKHQASRDVVTGLYNRRLLDEHLPKLVQQCTAERSPLALLMIDVDYFKGVNDTLGHAAGDQLLCDVGRLIQSSIREQDMAFRFGGDEFVILLPGQLREQAQKLADRLVSLMDQLARTIKVERPPRLSIGIATLTDVAEPSAEALLVAADQVLYQHKHARRPAA